MANKHKSWKQVIRQRLAREFNTVSLSGRANPQQATCQGLEYKLWWPKIKTLVIVKKNRKPDFSVA